MNRASNWATAARVVVALILVVSVVPLFSTPTAAAWSCDVGSSSITDLEEGDTISATVYVRNLESSPQSIFVSWDIGGSLPPGDNQINFLLDPGERATYTFSTTADAEEHDGETVRFEDDCRDIVGTADVANEKLLEIDTIAADIIWY